MTEPQKDAIVAFLAVAALLVSLAFLQPPRASAQQLGEDELPEPLQTRRQRAAGLSSDAGLSRDGAIGILDQVFPANPTPTPFSPSFVLEVTTAGNVVLPGEPYMLIVAGKCPIEMVPPRCREDFKRLPAGASLACMRNDEIHQRLRPADPL